MVADAEDESWRSRARAEMLNTFVSFCSVLDSAGHWLTDEEASVAACAGRAHLVYYQALAEDAHAANLCLWKLRPKTHYLAHVIEELPKTFENPKYLDLFAWEDFVGRIKRIAAKTHRATSHLRTVQRWMLLVTSRWGQRATAW